MPYFQKSTAMAQHRTKEVDPSSSRARKKRRKGLRSKPPQEGKLSSGKVRVKLPSGGGVAGKVVRKKIVRTKVFHPKPSPSKSLRPKVFVTKKFDVTAATEALAAKELRVARLARISKLAEAVFGDRDKADRWLGKPKRALGGKAPLSYLTDENGEQTIKRMLYQIDYGVFS
jgi:hypothetical protein